MTTTKLQTPFAYQTFYHTDGLVYTSDTNKIISIPTQDIPTFLRAGCIFPSDTVTGIDNLAGTTAPTTSNDSTQGYSVGSIWIDTVGKASYVCSDPTATAAVWVQQGGSIISLNAVASATLTRTSSTVLTNVAGMVVTLVPGTYKFKVDAPCVSTANTGIQAAFKLTTTVITSCAISGKGFSAAGDIELAVNTTTTDQTPYFDTAAGVMLKLEIDGTMVIGTGGTIQFQMAQHTSHADSTSVYAGAYMSFTRIA